MKKNPVKYPIVQRSASEVQISLDVGNLSTVDKSDLLTVRSVPVEEPPLAASDEVADSAYGDLIFSLAASDTEAEIGGINHIPGLTDEDEQKLMLLDESYQSDDISTFTRHIFMTSCQFFNKFIGQGLMHDLHKTDAYCIIRM